MFLHNTQELGNQTAKKTKNITTKKEIICGDNSRYKNIFFSLFFVIFIIVIIISKLLSHLWSLLPDYTLGNNHCHWCVCVFV